MALMSCLNFRGYKRTATGLPLNLIASMFLSKLTISGNTEQRNLPEGYTQVEYLQSTGTQWIVTDITSDQDTGIYLEAAFDEIVPVEAGSNPSNIFLGCVNNNFYISSSSLTGNFSFGRKSGTGATDNGDTGIIADTLKHTFKNNYLNDGLFVVDDTEKTVSEATFTNNYGMAIFRTTYSSAPGYYNTPCKAKIYRIKISQGAEVIHDIFPCTRDTDSKPGMYDTMTDTFMTNAGTGEFMAGAEVAEPTPDNPIDVQLCGDRTANLFDVNNPMDIAFENDNGWITVTYNNSEGTTTEYVGALVKPSEEIEPNTDYIIVTEVESLASGVTIATNSVPEDMYKSQFATQVAVTQTGTNIVQATSRNSFANCTTILRTFVAYHAGESGTCKFRISVLPVGTDTSNFVYEPYGYKINGEVQGLNFLSYDVFDQEPYYIDKDSTVARFTVDLPNGEYTVSTNIPSKTSSTGAILSGLFTSIIPDVEWSTAVDGVYANNPRTITVTDGVLYLGLYWRNADTNAYGDVFTKDDFTSGTYWIMINKGASALPYQPYNLQRFNVYTPYQIGKVDSAVDEIVLDMENKTAELTRQYRRYDFTGTESWTIEYATDYGDDGKRFAMVAGVPYSGRKKTPNNRFSTTTVMVHINNIMFSSGYHIYLYMSACSTVDELKTYLQNNPTYAYIPYSTPQTTDITALQDWDAMPDVKGTVTLTLSAEVEPSGVEAVYYSKERSTE